MKRYKTSKYNFFLEKDNLLANLVTDSLVRIEVDDLATIQHILSNPNEPIVLEHALDLKKHLIAQGFLIDEDFDEIGFLKIRSRISRYGNTGLGLTIIPTLDCNFLDFWGIYMGWKNV